MTRRTVATRMNSAPNGRTWRHRVAWVAVLVGACPGALTAQSQLIDARVKDAAVADAANRSACRLAMGVLGGVAGAMVGGWAGGLLEQAIYDGNPEAGLTGALIGIMAGAMLGVPIAQRACRDGDEEPFEIRLIGNARATLSDGTTTLPGDMPHESGAFDYMSYDSHSRRPAGATASDIAYDTTSRRAGSRIICPSSVTAALPDIEVAPTETYVAFRRKRQVARAASTTTRVDVELNLKWMEPAGRLGSSEGFNAMCSHRVQVTSPDEVDAELRTLLRRAYDAAN